MAASVERLDLHSQPWRPFSVNQEAFLVKSLFLEDKLSYAVSVCDLKTVWSERINHEDFERRCKELNKNVEAELSYLFDHVKKTTDSQRRDAEYSVMEDETFLTLRVKSTLSEDIPFTWECHCQKSDPQELKEHLVDPLLVMVGELCRRQKEMEAIIKKKDKQIQDYKDSGAKPSRRSLGTSTFESKTFQKEMVHSQHFESIVGQSVQDTFSDQVQDLYAQVMVKKALIKVKERPGTVAENSLSCGNTQSRIYSPQSSPASTPSSSPMKKPLSSPTKSPHKDVEKQRQEELKRRLEEELKRKEKKKKLKVNL